MEAALGGPVRLSTQPTFLPVPRPQVGVPQICRWVLR